MTNMKRICISLPEDLNRRVLNLRKRDRFIRCSYAEIVRTALELGLTALGDNQVDDDGGDAEAKEKFLNG